jgi:BatD DUF11 like domain
MRRLFLILLAALSPVLGRAQSAHWDPPGGPLPVGQVSQLQLVFTDCSPDAPPAPPKVDGLTIQYQGQSTNITWVNGSLSKNVTVSYAVLLGRQQAVDIPPFTVKTGQGDVTVPAAHYSPAGATVGSGVALSSVASSRFTLGSDSVWAGEVFDLKYTVDVDADYAPTWGRGTIDWDPSPLVAEDWGLPEQFTTRGAGARTGFNLHSRAFVPSAGHVRLNPASQLVNLSVGVAGFGFFQQRQYQQFAVTSAPASIDVRPLPPSPQGFSGAVGTFSLSSKIVPSHVRAGEPVTWTVELSGTGNWPVIKALPQREVSSAFQVIQPKPRRTQPQGKLFEGSLAEDIVLVASEPGTYAIAPVDFTYFDPKEGRYRTATAPGSTVVVEAAAPAGTVTPVPGAPSVASTPAPEAKPPEAPSGTLGDPLPAGPRAAELLTARELWTTAAASGGAVLLLWLLLAYANARRTDPRRPRREARQRLNATLARIDASPALERPALLLAWQHDAAILCGVSHAAPAAQRLGSDQWAALWIEADRCLYGPKSELAADWTSRAREALALTPVKRTALASLFLPRNLFPLAVLVLVLPALRADNAAQSYRRGDFASATAAWRSAVLSEPLDPSARHNLALALAQQDQWGEAAAQACAAFIQRPQDPALARLVSTTSEKAGFVAQPVEAVLQSGPLPELARLASPAEWQRVLAGSILAGAVTLGLGLLGLYRRVPRTAALVASAVLLLASLLTCLAALVAHNAYGIAADPRAAITWRSGTLRSIPTEADVAQKTVPLAAGNMGIVDATFLRWVRLSFPGGETGWVPREELVFVWKNPAD